MRWLVLVNASAGSVASGGDGDAAERIREACARRGVVADVRTVDPRDVGRVAREAASPASHDAVVAAGGDGTASVVADAVRERVALGVIPLGTHNHFAKELGVPLGVAEAVDALAGGAVEPLDVAEVEGRLFLNFSALGFHPHVVAERDARRDAGEGGKRAATAAATWRVLFRLPLMVARIRSSAGPPLRRVTPSLVVCTNAHQMAVFGVEGVSYPDRGLLNLYVARATGPLGMAWLLLRALCRRVGDARRFEAVVLPDATVDVESSRVLVSVDGEVTTLRPPLRYRVLRGGLRVLRPRPRA
jgi:diacylglycerol kinase family enzyme